MKLFNLCIIVLLQIFTFAKGDYEIFTFYKTGEVEKYFSNITISYTLSTGYSFTGGCVDVSTGIPYVLTSTTLFQAPSSGVVILDSGLTSAIDCASTTSGLYVLQASGSSVLRQFAPNGTVLSNDIIQNGPLYGGSPARTTVTLWRNFFYISSGTVIHQYTLSGNFITTISIGVPVAGLAFAYSVSRAYVTSNSNVVTLFNPITWAPFGTLTGPSVSGVLSTTPDGKILIPNSSGAGGANWILLESNSLASFTVSSGFPIAVKTNLLNSCPGGCDVNGFCDGTCKCYVGWDLNATTCVDVNECTSKPCSDWTTTCVNIPGSFTCPCAPGTILNGTGLCQMCSGGYFSNNTNSANCDICPAGTWSKSKDQITGYGQLSAFNLTNTAIFGADLNICPSLYGCSNYWNGATHGFVWKDALTSQPDHVIVKFAKRWNCNGNSKTAMLNGGSYWGFNFPGECSGCGSPTVRYYAADFYSPTYYTDGVTSNVFAIYTGVNYEGLDRYYSGGAYASVETYGNSVTPATFPSGCNACPAGSSSDAGSTSCTACLPGTYSGYPGSLCLPCSPGSYSNSSGTINCSICPAGSFSAGGATNCSICPAGTFSSSNAPNCTACSPGSFSSSANSTSCSPCGNGTYSASGATNCTKCWPGSYANTTNSPTCTPCDAGTWNNVNGSINCTSCLAGTYSPSNSTQCFDCQPGSFSTARSPGCNACSPGSFSNTTRAGNCTLCKPGTWNNETSATVCHACPSGQYQNISGKTYCVDCDPGTYATGNAALCTNCDLGFENAYYGQSSCSVCNDTSFANTTGNLYCSPCPATTWSVATYDITGYTFVSTTPLDFSHTMGYRSMACGIASNTSAVNGFKFGLPANKTIDRIALSMNLLYSCVSAAQIRNVTFNNKVIAQLAIPYLGCYTEGICPASSSVVTIDFTVTAANLHATNYLDMSAPYLEVYDTMPSGGFADVTFYTANKAVVYAPSVCEACPAGTYGNGLGVGCINCPAGTYSNSTGTFECALCPPGTYSDEGADQCTPCGYGTASNINGTQYSCPACPFSYFMNRTGGIDCEPCPAGFTDSASKNNCTPCALGYYNNATASSCHPCDFGTFANATGTTNCAPCAPGTTAATKGQATCDYCAAGYYVYESGATACKKCAPGSHASQRGSANCTLCELGTAALSDGQADCDACLPGYFANETGLTQCIACDLGYYTNVTGSAECTVCAQGSYAGSIGTKNCVPCGSGEYGNNTGLTACSSCPEGTYATRGQIECTQCRAGFSSAPRSGNCTACALGYYRPSKEDGACTACPVNSITKVFAATSISSCVCDKGYYGPKGGPCVACSQGGFCSGGDSIEPAPGYFRSDKQNDVFLACASSLACPGYKDECGVGYTGRLCGQCATNYYHLNGKCDKCPNNSAWYILLFSIVAIIISIIFFRVGATLMRGAPIMFIFNLVQISALFGNFRLNWPKELRYLFDILSSINLNIDLFSPECAASFSYYDRWLVTLFLPLFMLIFLILILGILLALQKMKKFEPYDLSTYVHTDQTLRRYNLTMRQRLGNKTLTFNVFVNSVLLLLTVSYTFVNGNLFELFSCQEQIDGSYTLLSAPQYVCFDSKWYSMLPPAIIAFIAYTIGIPALCLTIVLKNRDKIRKRDLDFGDRYGVLFIVYDRNFFFWEQIVFGRKLLIIIARTLVTPLSQSVIGICSLFLALQLQAFWRPFTYTMNNKLEYLSILVPLVILFTGLLFYSERLPNQDAAHIISGFVLAFVVIVALLLVINIYHQILFIFAEKFKEKNLNTVERKNEQLISFIWHKHAPYVIKTFNTMEDDQKAEFIKYCNDLIDKMSVPVSSKNELPMITFQ